MSFPVPARAMLSLLGAATLILPAMGDVPPKLTAEERARMLADTASAAPDAARKAAEIGELEAKATEAANAADQQVAAFLQKAALTSLAVEAAPSAPPATKPETAAVPVYTAPTKPLEVEEKPDDTVIESQGGMYFDAAKGIFVYLKDVRLNNPKLTLTGANELKIFIDKKEKEAKPGDPKTGDGKTDPKKPDDAQKAADPNAKKASGLGDATASFGEVDHITATGAVRVLMKSVDGKPPVEASAAVLNYNVKTGETILHGGYPWVKSGDRFMRAKEPDLYLRIQKDLSFVTEGVWDSGGSLQSTPGGSGGLTGGSTLKDPKQWETYTTTDLKVTDFRTTINPKLPNLLVLGDSLSIGYTLPLRKLLDGKYNTVRAMEKKGAPVNCETSTRYLANMDVWLGKTKWSVITFNCGHWDTNRVDGAIVTPLETYRENLQKIVDRLKKTEARLIWVTSTALRDPASQKDKDLVIYNQAAREIMERNHIEICDVRPISSGFTSEREDDAHMNSKGSKILAGEVAKAIGRKQP
ncbi:MAG: SGNH/GDSL hydrolase family protein [Luteolibacter sp.]